MWKGQADLHEETVTKFSNKIQLFWSLQNYLSKYHFKRVKQFSPFQYLVATWQSETLLAPSNDESNFWLDTIWSLWFQQKTFYNIGCYRSGSQSPSRKQHHHPHHQQQQHCCPGTKRPNPYSTSRPPKLSSKPMKNCSKKYFCLSDIDEQQKCRTHFSDRIANLASYLERDKEDAFLLQQNFSNDVAVRRQYVVDDLEVEFDDDFPPIFGLTCPHPDATANAHEKVILHFASSHSGKLPLLRP